MNELSPVILDKPDHQHLPPREVEAATLPPPPTPAPSASSFPTPADTPTQDGPQGIRYDFNFGARLSLPEGNYSGRLRDADTGNVLYEVKRGGVMIRGARQRRAGGSYA